jgi:protein TonB
MTAPALILQGPDAREEFRRWILAAAIVCAAHVGLMAGYMLMPAAEPEGAMESPAVLIDFAPVPVAPASPDDIAPGPDMLEAQPTPKPPEQVEPQVVEPMPRIEAPAEVTLPLPEPKAVEKKPEENPDKQKSETLSVQESPPSPQTTAAPRSEQNTAATPQAPSPGSEASRNAIAKWRDLVVARLQQHKRYPATAEGRREQGVVTLSFSVDRSGRVLTRSILKSSGVAALDEEVLTMVQRAQPLPAFSPAMMQQSVNLVVPIRFSLR